MFGVTPTDMDCHRAPNGMGELVRKRREARHDLLGRQIWVNCENKCRWLSRIDSTDGSENAEYQANGRMYYAAHAVHI